MKVKFYPPSRNGDLFNSMQPGKRQQVKDGVADSLARVEACLGDRIELPATVHIGFPEMDPTIFAQVPRARNLLINLRQTGWRMTQEPTIFDGLMAHESSHLSDYLRRPESIQQCHQTGHMLITEGKADHVAEIVGGGDFRDVLMQPLKTSHRPILYGRLFPNAGEEPEPALAPVPALAPIQEPFSSYRYQLGYSMVDDALVHTGGGDIRALHAQPVDFFWEAARHHYFAASQPGIA